MGLIDKLKDLFTDEEEVYETKEIEVENSEEEDKLPTFMRNKIEEEERREEIRKQREMPLREESIISDREVVRTRSDNNFSFPVDMDEPSERAVSRPSYSSQNVLERERKVSELYNKPELYSKKEEPKPKKFKPTPVISPVYGVLDKNYTKDEVKVSDEKTYELQRPSRKVDFETVRNMPIVWEIIRSYSYVDKECKEGVFNLNTFIEYVKEVMKYIKLTEYDLKYMPYIYIFQLVSSTFGYKQYNNDYSKTGLLDFAFFRTNLCNYLYDNLEVISNELQKLNN